MNILIVGNGFDLSHYLPTKYDHFMDVMEAIENKNTGEKINNLKSNTLNEWMELLDGMFEKRTDPTSLNFQMKFDELFAETRDPSFIEKTKEFYLTESVEISAKDVLKLQYRLELNCWYQYFKDHVKEVKTWIDFETKIHEALKVVANFLVKLESKLDEHGYFDHRINFYSRGDQNQQIFLIREHCNLLEKLGILESGFYIDQTDYDDDGEYTFPIEIGDSVRGDLRYYIQSKHILNYSGFLKLNSDSLLSLLQIKLEEFIEIFNLYLELVINQLSQNSMVEINPKEWPYPDKIFSFNYTSTYQRMHASVEVEYLHGSSGEHQNIVMGISDLEDESLKKIKAYGFTKYQQKLFKNTDYLFLDNYKKTISDSKKRIEGIKEEHKGRISQIDSVLQQLEADSLLNLNFYIWGHSLDVSDRDYILDLFSLNDDIYRNVRVTVYYFNKPAQFALLNNLLAILGKDKVEQWMKNKWLQFKENPEIKFLETKKQEIA
jgi:hypothetical protein